MTGAPPPRMRRLVQTMAVLFACTASLLPAQPDGLHIRTGTREAVVPWITSNGARFLSASALARALGGTATGGSSGTTLDVCGVLARFVVGQRMVDLGSAGVEQLPVAVTRGGISGVLIPAQFVTDVLPRYGTGIVWDAEERELRRFSTYARRAGSATSVEPRATTTVRSDDPPPVTTITANGDASVLRPDADARPVAIGGGAVRPAATRPVPAPSRPGTRRRDRSVVIDAGHGGVDPGTSGIDVSGRRVYEKNVTLAIARRVADVLRSRGVTVHMTRTTDTLIALSDRGRIANRLKADLFASIHVNGANPNWRNPSATRGFETYFLAEAKTEDESRVERMENEAVKFETTANAPAGDPLSFIINDMAQNEHLRESNELAGLIQSRFRAIHPGPSRGVKQANFAVLRGSFMPAVLIEVGFASNPSEAAWIADPERQQQLATGIADAIVDYLARYERRVGNSP
jgi:N-acetylmuramoyl-L-alanine amidase